MRDYVEGILLAERNAEIMKQHATLMTELANQENKKDTNSFLNINVLYYGYK